MNDSIDVAVNAIETDEEMPFRWKLTKGSDKNLKVEVGDEFVPSDLFGDSPEGMIVQVGADALMAGCRLMGLSHDDAGMILRLALKLTAGEGDE